ncbi:hypothetical protein PR202_ga22067 [Eleusine coracana subsp. coracana]|uniref:Uncharacterized protein n=1 Tax=Eleusine coracana subsp. coracana TaxID=191504 RepID=A0AAV5D0N8_ELECO|nr:hypothetical protein PR202_ga22067 [Eleusine coracana subsp. coracana]
MEQFALPNSYFTTSSAASCLLSSSSMLSSAQAGRNRTKGFLQDHCSSCRSSAACTTSSAASRTTPSATSLRATGQSCSSGSASARSSSSPPPRPRGRSSRATAPRAFEQRPSSAFLRMVKRGVELSSLFDLRDLFPSSRLVRMLPRSRKAERHRQEMFRLVDDILRHHEAQKMMMAGHGERDQDMVDVLLRIQRDSSMRDVFGAALDHVNKHSPMGHGRAHGKPKGDGENTARGTILVVNVWAISRDPRYWDKPDKFMPERFEGERALDFKGLDFEYTPFGAGRRICPGTTFAQVNVEIALASLLYHFDWELPAGTKPEDIDMTEQFGVTVSRKSELRLHPIPCIPTSTTKHL